MNMDTPTSHSISEYKCGELDALLYVIPPEEQTHGLLEKLTTIAKHAGTQRDETSGLTRFAQAFKAISFVIDHTKGSKSHTQAEIISLFDQLFNIKSTVPYEKHSIGIEIEFGCEDDNSQMREIRLGPFTDIKSAMKALRLAREINDMCGDNPLSTLHLNFGLDEQQKSNLVESDPVNLHHHGTVQFIKKPYCDITEKLAYISNSTARNIKISGNYSENGLPYGYYLNDKYCGDFVKADIKPVGVDGQYHDQVARLECKGFCLAHDAHFDMLEPFIGAMWKAIDDPAKAQKLSEGLTTIFTDANIIPLHAAMPGCAKKWNALGAESHEETKHKLDFGLLQPILNEKDEITRWDVIGRQVSWRPVVQDYLNSILNDKEPRINEALYTPPDELQYYAEEMREWELKHPEPTKIWSTENAPKQMSLKQSNAAFDRGS